MSDDWIKMRKAVPTCPEVVRILSACDADACPEHLRVVGALHALWSLFDTHSEDGKLPGYGPAMVDRLIGWPGFTAAVIAAGWANYDGETLALPNYELHNGRTAKRRANDAKRKKGVRSASAKCPPAKRTNRALEKEKEKEEEKSFKATAKATSKAVLPSAEKSLSRTRDPEPDTANGARAESEAAEDDVESTPTGPDAPTRPTRPLPKGVVSIAELAPAVAACIAIRQAGTFSVNANDPRLLEAVKAGVTPVMFGEVAAEAASHEPPKGFGWIVATAKGRMQDATALPSPRARRNPTLPERMMAAALENMAADTPNVIDVGVRRVGRDQ